MSGRVPWLTRRTGQGRLERLDQRSKMPNALGGWCQGCKLGLGLGFGFDAAVNRADWPLRTSSPKKRLTTERFLRHGACIAAVMGWAPAPLHRSAPASVGFFLAGVVTGASKHQWIRHLKPPTMKMLTDCCQRKQGKVPGSMCSGTGINSAAPGIALWGYTLWVAGAAAVLTAPRRSRGLRMKARADPECRRPLPRPP